MNDLDSGDPDDLLERHERRIVRCRSCRAQIIWFKTDNGRNMPVDADTVDPEDQELDLDVHKSHFATCKDAGTWRKPR